MTDAKSCPYCGEEILAVAIKCKHCGSNLEEKQAAKSREFSMRPIFKVFLVLALLLLSADLFYKWDMTGVLSGRGFSESEIEIIENDIIDEFEKEDGLKVEEVALIKTSATSLEGFVKIRTSNNAVILKECNASKGKNHRIIWECGSE